MEPEPRHVRLRAQYAGVGPVFLGGMVGTLLRILTGFVIPSHGAFPFDIFLANLLGAFLLALNVGVILGSSHLTKKAMKFRLFFGTGAMGGFTTYSTLSFHTAELVQERIWNTAFVYPLATVVGGGLATFLGLCLGRRLAATRAMSVAERPEHDC